MMPTADGQQRHHIEREPGGTTVVAVHAVGLRLAYGDHAVLDLDQLTIPARQVTAVLGPNGSGKSSLLDAIAGLLTPKAGSVAVFGRPAGSRRKLAYALQHTDTDAVVPLTVHEVVRMGRYPHRGMLRRLRAADHDAVNDALGRLDIRHLARRQLSELSGGERQRSFVAQALAQQAPLLLLDEPTAALDVPTQQRIAEVMVDECRRGSTIVHTTHSVAAAERADWVLLLAGRLVAAGPPAEVLNDERLAEAYGARMHAE
ncbi:metal ABC transporter ATP-binding protein [Amycolatopsis palatopharyngis]|uniref:metal ABC transporter ATP-binding protein n=1 Tax=Amycolatopsis palatopharyngis TaxID=187982 RepID=UPI001FE9359D|nr:metal ABC transporter ATP-binding protein [Amycolatopsis palatopharyngis]